MSAKRKRFNPTGICITLQFVGLNGDELAHIKSVELLKYRDKTCLHTGLAKMWEWAQAQPKKEVKSWDEFEITKNDLFSIINLINLEWLQSSLNLVISWHFCLTTIV